MQLRVFLDTNVLLRAFASVRRGHPAPLYLTDENVERIAFEKNLFEAYVAFRGVGGKKPDEGRGDWAQRHLTGDDDPSTVSTLASRHHGSSNELAFLWTNQILEASSGLDADLERTDQSWPSEELSVGPVPADLWELFQERRRYAQTCAEFDAMLQAHGVRVLAYHEVFNPQQRPEGSLEDAANLGRFVQSSALPSEDLEIVYAALSAGCSLFVTDDRRLQKTACSLGLNRSLSGSSFCSGEDYAEKVVAVQRGDLVGDPLS